MQIRTNVYLLEICRYGPMSICWKRTHPSREPGYTPILWWVRFAHVFGFLRCEQYICGYKTIFEGVVLPEVTSPEVIGPEMTSRKYVLRMHGFSPPFFFHCYFHLFFYYFCFFHFFYFFLLSVIISDIFFKHHFQQVTTQNSVQQSSLPRDFLRAW